METELQPGQSAMLIQEIEEDFPVTVLARIGRCPDCHLPVYRMLTACRQEINLCRSALLLPN